MNIECSLEPLNELVEAFKFNDAVLRHLVIKRKKAITEASAMLKTVEENAAKGKHRFRANDNYESRDKVDSASDNEDNIKQRSRPLTKRRRNKHGQIST